MQGDMIKKIKYVLILEILKRDSDVDKPISTNELLKKLKMRGICLDRKILYRDIAVLNAVGYEIISVRKKQNQYYILDREFDIPELRILMDAVEAATFISENKTKELLLKIAELGGSYRQKLLLRNNSYFNTNKHSNPHIYYSINEIEEAINSNKKVLFKYFDMNHKAEKVYRKKGINYTVNPVATIFSNDNYYLVSTNDKYEGYANYRIDRMEDCQVSTEDRTKTNDVENFKIGDYRKMHFGMFIGKTENVVLEFDGSIIDIIFDVFGENTKITATDNRYEATFQVSVSNQFYGFVSGLSNRVKIKSPQWVVKDYKQYILTILEKYKEIPNE